MIHVFLCPHRRSHRPPWKRSTAVACTLYSCSKTVHAHKQTCLRAPRLLSKAIYQRHDTSLVGPDFVSQGDCTVDQICMAAKLFSLSDSVSSDTLLTESNKSSILTWLITAIEAVTEVVVDEAVHDCLLPIKTAEPIPLRLITFRQ